MFNQFLVDGHLVILSSVITDDITFIQASDTERGIPCGSCLNLCFRHVPAMPTVCTRFLLRIAGRLGLEVIALGLAHEVLCKLDLEELWRIRKRR